jgi:Phage tail sheath protein subtilisin-like domain
VSPTFSPTNRPPLPGVYTQYETNPQQVILASSEETVAILFTHNWGPFKRAIGLPSYQDYLAQYGITDDDGKLAVRGAFQGEGLVGYPGAGSVIAYRFGTAAAAKATHTFQNSTPVNALKVDALYEGTRGNGFLAEIRTNVADATQRDFVVYEGTTVLETYTFAPTNLAALAAQVNAQSQFVRLTVLIDGVAIPNTAIGGAALAGGDDGITGLAAGDYSAAFTAVSAFRWSAIACANLTDSSIIASFAAFVDGLNDTGQRVMGVVGGAAAETVAAAVSRSAAINSPNVLNVGVGTYEDTTSGQQLSTAQLAGRVAGILAARGERLSLTFARLAGLDIVVGPSRDDQATAVAGGVITFGKDSNALAPVRIVKGVTTFTTKTDAQRKYEIYSNPKFVRTEQGFETELQEVGQNDIIGKLPINKDTRDEVLTKARKLLQKRERSGIIQSGWTLQISSDPPPQPTDDFVAVDYQWVFGRTAEQLFGRVVVS